MSTRVIRLPLRGRPAAAGATRRARVAASLRELVGRWLVRVGVPGFVADVEIHDDVTGHTIGVQTGPLFTRVTVDGRDFYFRRLTGRYDGAGVSRD